MIPYVNSISITVPSGAFVAVSLPAPPRGLVTRLIVAQNGGTAAGFSYDLFSRLGACANETDDDDVPKVKAVYRLQAQQTVAALATVGAQYGLSLDYLNQDDRDSVTKRATGMLYLDLKAEGTGDKTFDITYAIRPPDIV